MEVVAVRGVVLRAEHRIEPLARALVNHAQELPLTGRAAVPGAFDHDPATVLEHEARYVDGRTCRMGRAPVRPGDVAARIAAEGFDAAHRRSEDLSRRAVDIVPRPTGKGLADFASYRAEIGDSEARRVGLKTGEPNRTEDCAALIDIAVRYRGVLGAGPAEFGEALGSGRVAGKRGIPGRRGGGMARGALAGPLGQNRASGKQARRETKQNETADHRAIVTNLG